MAISDGEKVQQYVQSFQHHTGDRWTEMVKQYCVVHACAY